MRRVSETQVMHLSELIDTLAPRVLLQEDLSELPTVFKDWHRVNAASFALAT